MPFDDEDDVINDQNEGVDPDDFDFYEDEDYWGPSDWDPRIDDEGGDFFEDEELEDDWED